MDFLIYFILLLIIPMWAQFKLKRTYSKYSKIRSTSGHTGAQGPTISLIDDDERPGRAVLTRARG